MNNGIHFYETLSLFWMGLIVGITLIAKHAWAIYKKKEAITLLQKFPRNDKFGRILLWVTMSWFWFMCLPNSPVMIPLEEFAVYRNYFLIGLPILTFFLQTAVKDFIAIRFAGFGAILWGWPVLQSHFLKYPVMHWLVPIYGIALIWFGMFAVGKPYLIRNLITWVTDTNHPKRYQIASYAGLGYGILTFLSALLFWKGY